MSRLGDVIDVNRREVRRHLKTVDQINDLEPEVGALDEDALRHRFDQLRARARDGEPLEDLTVASFAITREAVRRSLGIRLHDLQLTGALVVAAQELAEMRGGEGKTVSAILPACLWALPGRGVHVFTADGPQARHDAVWLGAAYRSLGLSVGVLLPGFDEGAVVDPHGLEKAPDGGPSGVLRRTGRREAYDCDITYGTLARFAGDYLQDQMVARADRQVQRGLAAAIVDDADAILLERGAALSLLASRTTREAERFTRISGAATRFREGVDYRAGGDGEISLLAPGREALTHTLRAAGLRAELAPADLADLTLLLRGGAYVRAGRDGSVTPGTMFVIDLDLAVPPAPALPESSGWEVWGRMGAPSLLRLYESLGGLAGAALSCAATLDTQYELDVVPIPRSGALERDDLPDSTFETTEEKLNAVVAEAEAMRARDRPVVIGVTTWPTRSRLEEMLRERGVDVRHSWTAGEPSVVVVSGLPVRLHPDDLPAEMEAAGGLHVIGAEHGFWRFHDEVLRDLAGRRGGPGSTHFFCSAEDATLRYDGEGLADDVAQAWTDGADPDTVAGAVARLQQRREETRESISEKSRFRLEREDAQRESVYDELDGVRDAQPRGLVEDLIRAVIQDSVHRHRGSGAGATWPEALVADLSQVFPLGDGAQIPEQHLADEEPDLVEFLVDAALVALDAKEAELGGAAAARARERRVLLRTWCRVWRDQLATLDSVWRELEAGFGEVSPISPYRGWVPLARYQQFPLLASRAFDDRLAGVPRAAVRALFRARPHAAPTA
ncbi:MAG: hypothetical protein J2P38_04100 [Candidatus Dormibacteraeota bacterium]|nr:hypothetical protein [Candidatus Dormibacteraeota bacterium]